MPFPAPRREFWTRARPHPDSACSISTPCVAAAHKRAHKNRRGEQIIEIEVRSLEELEQALEHGGEAILLDNMSVEDVTRAVERCSRTERRIPLEVSGGITLENVRAYAETGVNFISVGAITHSAKASDMSMRLAPV